MLFYLSSCVRRPAPLIVSCLIAVAGKWNEALT